MVDVCDGYLSMLPNGYMDDYSLHSGCDVLDEVPT
jgi:hypothetical protein